MGVLSIKNVLNLILALVLLTSSVVGFSADKNSNAFSIIYLKAENKRDQFFESWIKEAPEVEAITSLINEELILVKTDEKPLTLVFGADDGPLFDSEQNQIHIPYSFLREVEGRFKKAKYLKETGVSAEVATMDALMHTIFHELAHALIFQFDLPVLGREEDAADGLASVLLIEYFDEGQETVITAADLFDLESNDITEYQAQDYWGEHSLDIQRYYSAMCHVFGSSPKKYKQIKVQQEFTDEKAENCIDDYQVLLNSWMLLLEPFLKRAPE